MLREILQAKISFTIVMATREEYEQLTAYARIDGAIVGCMWIASFACFVINFRYPIVGMIGLIIGVVSIVWACLRLRRFRDNILDGVISFRRAFCYSILIYLHAALIMAFGQYAYLQFMDHGYLISQYTQIMSNPDFISMLNLYGMTQDNVKLAMDTLANLRPIDFSLQFFTMNIILGIIVSLPIAFMIKQNIKRNY